MAQHCERRTVESQQRRLVDAAERIGEQRGPEPAQVQHDRRLLRRSRHFSGDVDRALRIGAQVKRGGERTRQRMRIEILRVVRAGVRFPRPLPGAECALQLGGHDARRRRASTAGSAASDLRDCARTTPADSRRAHASSRCARPCAMSRARASLQPACSHRSCSAPPACRARRRARVRPALLRSAVRYRAVQPRPGQARAIATRSRPARTFPESTASCANARIASTALADARRPPRSAIRCE